MNLFQIEIDPKEDAATRLISDVGDKLQGAFLEEKDTCKLTLQGLAERLGTDRSHIHRALNGHSNMTLRSLAELAWGLDREIEFNLFDPKLACVNSYLGYSHQPASVQTNRVKVYSIGIPTTTTPSAGKAIFTVVDQEDA